MGNNNSKSIDNNNNLNGLDLNTDSIIPKNHQDVITIYLNSSKKIIEQLNNQNNQEKLVLNNLFLKFSENRNQLEELFIMYTCRTNIIESKILIFDAKIQSIQKMVEINDPKNQTEVNSQVDNILMGLLENIDRLENMFEINGASTDYLKDKTEKFLNNSRLLVEEICKTSQTSKIASILTSLTGILGIGGTTALTATECVGVTTLIATGATSIFVVAPYALPVIATFGGIVCAGIAIYQESKERKKNFEMLKSILKYYIENIEFISQTMDEIIKSVCKDLKTKVTDFKDLEPKNRVDFDLKSIKDEFSNIIDNQKKIIDRIKEMKDYERNLSNECYDLRKKNIKQIKN